MLSGWWPASAGPLTAGRDVLLVLAGVGAGVVNAIAGGGSLVSFPTLLAMGYPALTANVTNTVGIWPGYATSLVGFRGQLHEQGQIALRLAVTAIAGAVGGAVLLLTTPAADFQEAAPGLLLFASALFAAQPLVVRALDDLGHDHPTRRILLYGGVFCASVYGGYFGAGLGVVVLAVLGVALPDTLPRSIGLRTVIALLVNGAAALVFIAHASIVWEAAGLLAIGALVGGWLGALVAVRVPAWVLRVVIVLLGTATALRLLVG